MELINGLNSFSAGFRASRNDTLFLKSLYIWTIVLENYKILLILQFYNIKKNIVPNTNIN